MLTLLQRFCSQCMGSANGPKLTFKRFVVTARRFNLEPPIA